MRRVSKEQEEKTETQSRKIKDLKYLIKLKTVNGIDGENPKYFRNAKRILTVVRSGVGTQQILAMIDEANPVLG